MLLSGVSCGPSAASKAAALRQLAAGQAFRGREDWLNAIHSFDESARLDPGQTDAYLGRASAISRVACRCQAA